MDGCDICGKQRKARPVMLEGAEVNACYGCVPKGASEGKIRKARRAPKKVKERVLLEDFSKVVREAISAKGWDLKTAAKELGISESYLRHIEKGDMKPDEKTVRKLEKGLNIKLMEEEVIGEEEAKIERKKKEFTLEEQAVWE